MTVSLTPPHSILSDASSAWAGGFFGDGVTVAVLDAGIAPHPIISGKVIASYDAIQGTSKDTFNPDFCPNHGLGVASIIAGSHDVAMRLKSIMGVAPNVKLLNVRCTAKENPNEVEVIARGISWAVKSGAKVLCIPINHERPQTEDVILTALRQAKLSGVVTIIIGGNYSTWGGTWLARAAREHLAIAVGNLDIGVGRPFHNSNVPGDFVHPWVMASSSGTFPKFDGGDEYMENGGTSFAGPYVAGLAALLIQQNPNASVDEIMHMITAGAVLEPELAR